MAGEKSRGAPKRQEKKPKTSKAKGGKKQPVQQPSQPPQG